MRLLSLATLAPLAACAPQSIDGERAYYEGAEQDARTSCELSKLDCSGGGETMDLAGDWDVELVDEDGEKASGAELDTVTCHCTFGALARRETLSTLYATYRFIQSEFHHGVWIWDSVLQERTAFVGVLPLLYLNWRWRWLPGLDAVDASEEGYALMYATSSSDVTRRLGRQSERSRYRLGASLTRSQPAASAGLRIDPTTNHIVVGSDDIEGGDASGSGSSVLPPSPPASEVARWELNPKFEEVSTGLLEQEHWVLVRRGRCRYRD